MNTLHLYGCSHGLLLTGDSPRSGPWISENTYGDILSKKLNYHFDNKSVPGDCNFNIFSKVLTDLENNLFNKDDIVLVQWSHIDRTWSKDDGTLMPFHADEHGTSKGKVAKVFYSAFHDDLQCFSTTLGWNYILQNTIDCNYYWSTSNRFVVLETINKFLYDKMRLDSSLIVSMNQSPLERMYSLGNKENIFPCYHATSKGHVLIAEYYYQEISKLLEM